jgi:predicted nucleotidyltransferase
MEQYPRLLLAAWARRQPEIRALYVFGSRAMKIATPRSDLDLAVKLVASQDDRMLVFLEHRSRWRRDLSRITGLVVTDLELYGLSTSSHGTVEVFGAIRPEWHGRLLVDQAIPARVGLGR